MKKIALALIFVLSPLFLFAQKDIKNRMTVFAPKDAILEKTWVYSVSATPKGTIWGTKDGVFFEKPDGSGMWFNPKNSPFLVQNISAVAFHQGDLWFTSRTPVDGQGIFRFNGKNWINYNHELLSPLVSCMHEDSMGNFWVGYDVRGINMFVGGPTKSPMINFSAVKEKHGLLAPPIFDIKDNGNLLYIGTPHGLCGFPISRRTKGRKKKREKQDEPEVFRWRFPEFPANNAKCLAPYQGKVAVGTELGLVVPNGSKWKLYGRKEGLRGAPVDKLCYDGKRLWLGDQAGIHTFENGNFTLAVDSDTPGFPTPYPTCLAALPQADGTTKVFVGTMKGARVILIK